jgi:RAD51-like protein 1
LFHLCFFRPGYQIVALLERVTFLATDIVPLDVHLCGGLPSRSVTEIVGPSGAGKTQFCLMMTCKAVLPESMGGRGGKVVYIDTEGAFNAGRLQEIAANRFPSYFNCDETMDLLLASVITKPIQSSAELNALLLEMEALIITENVRFVVLDSIASKIRHEFDNTQIHKRQAMLLDQAQTLKQLAERFNLQILVSNQVTTKLGEQVNEAFITAALGPLWAHAVNTRLVLEKLSEESVGSKRLWSAKSPLCSVAHLVCDIAAKGLVAASHEMEYVASNYWGVDGAIRHAKN